MNLNEPAFPSWEALYASAAGGLLLTDTAGLILRVNQTFSEWLGYQPTELIGKQRLTKLLTVGSQLFYQTHLEPLLQAAGQVTEVKLQFRRSDGAPVRMIVNCKRRMHSGSTFDEIFAIQVLDRHKFEEELVLARRTAEDLNENLANSDRRKDEFIAVLSHELRNPLAPMRNVIEIVKRKKIDDPQIVWAHEVMARQLDHMQHLIDDLLEVSRIVQGKFEFHLAMVDLSRILSDAAEVARPTIERAGHRLNVKYPPLPVQLMGDATRLVQILANLLNNASKFTLSGGSIELSGNQEADDVVLRVTDSGMGIEPQQLQSIFEMFAQVKGSAEHGGLGIGLALSRRLTELHGGSIQAESEGLGAGSTFTVRIPIRRMTPLAAQG